MDTIVLLTKYSRDRDMETRDRIFNLNVRLVWEIAHLYKSKAPSQQLEDLFQIASIGMLNAIEKFDVSKGAKFNSYAGLLMHHELCRYLHNDSPVKISRNLSDTYMSGRKLIKKGYSDTAIAQALGIDIDYWLECKNAYQSRVTFALDQIFFDYNPNPEVIKEEYTLLDVYVGDQFSYLGDIDFEPVEIPRSHSNVFNKLFMEWASLEESAKLAKASLNIKRKDFTSWIRDAIASLTLT